MERKPKVVTKRALTPGERKNLHMALAQRPVVADKVAEAAVGEAAVAYQAAVAAGELRVER